MDNSAAAAEAQVLMNMLDQSLLEDKVTDCVTPFVDSLKATFTDAQLSTNKPQFEEPIGSPFDILDKLGEQLPEAFGLDALRQYVEHQQELLAMADRAYNRAMEQLGREENENG